MLVKKGAVEKYRDVIQFLTGDTLGAALEKHGLPPANPYVSKQYPGTALNWVGWDFIEKSDLCGMNTKIRTYFVDKFFN